jgi:hypothetical protein
VSAASVRARGGDCELVGLDDRANRVLLERMLDPDPPAELWHGASRQTHVAARADGEVADPHIAKELSGPIDRPALDETGRIERPGCPRVEVTTRLVAHLLAAVQHPANLRERLRHHELASGQPADLAVVLVRAEGRVDPPEPGEHVLEPCLVDVVTDVHHDRHPHHVLDATDAGQHLGDCGHGPFAFIEG